MLSRHRQSLRLPHPDRRAVAMVEMSLLLPLLMLIVLAAVDFGRFAHSYIAVTNGARAGAGFASINRPTNGTIGIWQTETRAAVLDELSQTLTSTGVAPADVTVTTNRVFDSGNNGPWRAEVTVSMPFQTLVAWPTLPSNVTLQRFVVLRGIR